MLKQENKHNHLMQRVSKQNKTTKKTLEHRNYRNTLPAGASIRYLYRRGSSLWNCLSNVAGALYSKSMIKIPICVLKVGSKTELK